MFFQQVEQIVPLYKTGGHRPLPAIIPITAHRISTMISIAVITFAVYLRAIIKSRQ